VSDAGPWLLLDVGNSAIKWRLASASGLFSEGGRADDVATLSAMLEGRDWYRVAIASVAADSRDTTLAEVASAGRPVEVHYATADAELLGLRNRYPAPQSLGVDRWLAMLAAWHHLGGPLCVVDAGTAITLDLIARDGMHQGGFILPGAELMHRSLGMSTGKIRVNSLTAPAVAPGEDTAACVSGGIWLAVKGLLGAAVDAYPEHRFVLTGGGAAGLLTLTSGIEHQPDLVMEGLRLWLLQQLDDRLP
jgi:type III pantothenate kinase